MSQEANADATKAQSAFPDRVFLAKRHEFERYLNQTCQSETQRAQLKQERRRRKNAQYAREHRARRAAVRRQIRTLSSTSIVTTSQLGQKPKTAKSKRITPTYADAAPSAAANSSQAASRPFESPHDVGQQTDFIPPADLALQLRDENRRLRALITRLGYDPDLGLAAIAAEEGRTHAMACTAGFAGGTPDWNPAWTWSSTLNTSATTMPNLYQPPPMFANVPDWRQPGYGAFYPSAGLAPTAGIAAFPYPTGMTGQHSAMPWQRL
eukprot:TRINITY_DN11979_c1_g11_i1.p1 TRINITY_DN11979_c1_g11~~TRINITY_DN11979_c1_g11_i1.p1  ORF type:complete len:266 (+),score=16.96 TRINITY_DN11979_c1_g11_i1:428-1225(+)